MAEYQGYWKPQTLQQEMELETLEEQLLGTESFQEYSKLVRTFPHFNQKEMEMREQIFLDMHPEEMIQLELTLEQKAHNQKILEYMDQNRGLMDEFFHLMSQMYPEKEYPKPYQKTKE